MMRKMVSKLTILIIMIGLFLLLALRNSFAQAHRAQAPNTFKTAIKRDNGVMGRKAKFEHGLIRANNQATKKTKVTIGRKMVIHYELQEDDHKMMKNLTPMLSGNHERHASKNSRKKSHGGSENQGNYQKFSNTLSAKNKEQVTREPRAKHGARETLQEAKEIMKLMQRDYYPDKKPKKKPPINNHNVMH